MIEIDSEINTTLSHLSSEHKDCWATTCVRFSFVCGILNTSHKIGEKKTHWKAGQQQQPPKKKSTNSCFFSFGADSISIQTKKSMDKNAVHTIFVFTVQYYYRFILFFFLLVNPEPTIKREKNTVMSPQT